MLCRYVLGILLVLAVFPSNGFSAESSVSVQNQTCMMCHSVRNRHLTFGQPEKKVSLKVNTDRKALGRAVCSQDNKLALTATGLQQNQHPKRTT